MTDSSNLCLSCGYCCDGTVIGFVELQTEEIPTVKKVMDIEVSDGNGFFLQPCSKFCDGCTIYEERPTHCASFKCGLLTRFEQKEIDFESALDSIKEVKEKRTNIEEKLSQLTFELKSTSMYFKLMEVKNKLASKTHKGKLTLNQETLLIEIKELDQLLSCKFGFSM